MMIYSDGELTRRIVLRSRQRPALLLLSFYHDFFSHDWVSKGLPMRSMERV